MSHLLRTWSGRTAYALCGAALSLSVLACGSDDSAPSVNGDKNAANAGDKGSSTTSKDAATKPVTKKDAGSSDDDNTSSDDDSTSDAGAGDKSPTGSADGTSTPFCAALAVIQDKCQSCHTAPLAAGAPMPLLTYADLTAPAVVTKGKKVYEVVSTRIHAGTMPAAAPLTAAEMAPIDAWIAAGVPQGDDPTCAGQPATTGGGGATADQTWPPAGCDQSYKLTVATTSGKPYSVPAGQEVHPQFTMDTPWPAGSQAIAFRPITDNAKVLHHWILNGQGGTTAFISGWAPGQDASLRQPLPDNIGIYLPSGKGTLRLDLHYNNLAGTTAELDSSGVEVCVTTKPRPVIGTTYSGFAQLGIFLPPGQETDVIGTCNVAITQPVFLMTESPHAHKLATHMKFEVQRAGQPSNVLHDSAFTFDAQISTPLPQFVELKAGDKVVTTCTYKNTTNGFVTFGENTGNEMCFNFASYYPMGALSCSGAAAIDVGKVFGGNP